MVSLTERVDALEKVNIAYDLLLQTLRDKDTETAHALNQLESVINDPKVGLIVTLDRYQEGAKADRRAQLAFFAGLVVVVNILVPFIPIVLRWLFPAQ